MEGKQPTTNRPLTEGTTMDYHTAFAITDNLPECWDDMTPEQTDAIHALYTEVLEVEGVEDIESSSLICYYTAEKGSPADVADMLIGIIENMGV